jgi:hypothetical protein
MASGLLTAGYDEKENEHPVENCYRRLNDLRSMISSGLAASAG